MAARLAARPDVLDLRRESVEHPFGTIKQWMNQGAFLMRRLENVRGEFSLTALAYNIKRAITIVGVPGMIAAAKARLAEIYLANARKSPRNVPVRPYTAAKRRSPQIAGEIIPIKVRPAREPKPTAF